MKVTIECGGARASLDLAMRRAADRTNGRYFNINRGIDARFVFAYLT